MIEFLSNPIFQGIGAIFGFVGIIVAVIAIFYSRNTKKLEYDVSVTTELLNIDSQIRNDLEIFYKGEKVDNFCLVIIKIINFGNTSILESDFVTPIQFSFGENAAILSSNIMNSKKDVTAEIEINKEKFLLKPLLINPKETITITFLVTRFSKANLVTGRIIGIKDIKRVSFMNRLLFVDSLITIPEILVYIFFILLGFFISLIVQLWFF